MSQKFRVTYATLSADNEELQHSYDEAVDRVRGQLGASYPVIVNGEERWHDDVYAEPSPIDKDLIIGRFSQSTVRDVQDAVAAAKAFSLEWERMGWRSRVDIMRTVADVMEDRLFDLAAMMAFEVGKSRLTTRLIEGDFPNYRQLIPQSYPNRLIVGKEPFLNAIRRVKLLAKDATPVRLTLRPDGLELVAVTQDVGQAREDLEAKYEGSEMVVAFNPEFLIDGVEAITGDEVQLDTLDALKPATVRSTENPNFLYLLMPVRVS